MPKPMPIRLQVEEIAFGRIFRLLSAMPGVVAIDIDAESPKQKAPRAAKGSKADGTSSACIILAAIARAPCSRKELEKIMVASGKKASTLNGALHNVVKAKRCKPNGKGAYVITAAGKDYLAKDCEG